MDNERLHTAISHPRFSRYYVACENNKRRAIRLYRGNILLSQKMYALIGIFEVILRNSIDRHFIRNKGNYWLEEAVQPGGYLDVAAGCEEAFHSVQEALERLGPGYTHDGLITKLSFGFWTYQFAKKQYAASGNSLLNIFPGRPVGVNQKIVFQDLMRINDIRNRIAHYEPICFDKDKGFVSTTLVSHRYDSIRDLLNWLGCNVRRILYGIDGVSRAINIVNAI